MLLALLALGMAVLCGFHESIVVRDFSLVTDKGERVLRPDRDRRRMSDSLAARRLTLTFVLEQKRFKFEFQKSDRIFAPNTTVSIIGQVRVMAA